jgi:hypothetical protein
MSKTWRYKLVVEFPATDFPAAAHFMDTLTDCMDVNMGVTVAGLEKLGDPVTADDVILACAAEGLDVEVYPTGGGCLNFCYADDNIHVLFGEVGRDGSFDLGIAPMVKFDHDDGEATFEYDHELDARVQEAFPFSAYPDEEDARACARWMQRVVAWLLDEVDPITGGE